MDTSSVISLTSLFVQCVKLKNVNMSIFDISNVTNLSSLTMIKSLQELKLRILLQILTGGKLQGLL